MLSFSLFLPVWLNSSLHPVLGIVLPAFWVNIFWLTYRTKEIATALRWPWDHYLSPRQKWGQKKYSWTVSFSGDCKWFHHHETSMWLDFIPAAALFGQNDSDSKIIREAWHGFIIAEKIFTPQLAGCKLFLGAVLQNSLGVCWWFGLTQKYMNTQIHTQHSRSRRNLPGLLIKQIYLASMLDEELECLIQPASFPAFQT